MSRWQDFGYYARWWAFWVALWFSMVGLGRVRGVFPLLLVVAGGVLLGILAAIPFTFAQNSLNPTRRRVVSWLLAIGVYLVMNCAAVAVVYLLR